jgi:hypothetical protein
VTVDQKLDAHLELGPLLYVPPYGAITWGARITRQGDELFSVSRVNLALAEFPLKDKPIIISRLEVHEPVLSIAPKRFDNIAEPSGDPNHPHKLSDVLRLKEVRVSDGIKAAAEEAEEAAELAELSADEKDVVSAIGVAPRAPGAPGAQSA